MGTDDTPHPELPRLNAFVDGELAPSERAAVAAWIAADRDLARAHATLARLKACIGESADATPPVAVAAARKRTLGVARGLGLTALAACTAIALYAAINPGSQRKSAPLVARDAVVTLAALPASPVIPNLDVAGLTLEDVEVGRVGDVRLLVASYRGPHGCRLELNVRAASTTTPPSAGTSRHGWEVGDLAYELVAHGMPGWRFAVIADAAERETREGRTPDAVGRRLREARAAAPPCAG
jgi:hypothetical protein